MLKPLHKCFLLDMEIPPAPRSILYDFHLIPMFPVLNSMLLVKGMGDVYEKVGRESVGRDLNHVYLKGNKGRPQCPLNSYLCSMSYQRERPFN